MNDGIKKIFYSTTAEVFETMFFTFLEPLHEVPSRQEWGISVEYIESVISYVNDMQATVRFYFSKQLAQHIAVNFLGIDESGLNAHQVIDTARETANMTVGNLLGKLDPAGSCKLAIPQAREVADFTPEEIISEPGLFVFNTEFGLLWIVYQETEVRG